MLCAHGAWQDPQPKRKQQSSHCATCTICFFTSHCAHGAWQDPQPKRTQLSSRCGNRTLCLLTSHVWAACFGFAGLTLARSCVSPIPQAPRTSSHPPPQPTPTTPRPLLARPQPSAAGPPTQPPLRTDRAPGRPLPLPLVLLPAPSSRRGAARVIYLDFTGHVTWGTIWRNFSREVIHTPPYDTDGRPDTFSEAEAGDVIDIWRAVSEDYAPFDVDVTTGARAADGVCPHGAQGRFGGGRVHAATARGGLVRRPRPRSEGAARAARGERVPA